MNGITRAEWLAQLKAGDEVVLAKNTPGGYVHLLSKVERTTKTQIIVSGLRFSVKNGWPVGDTGYFRSELYPANEKYRGMVLHERLVRQFLAIKPQELTTEQLQAIQTIVKGAAKEGAAA